MDDDDLKIDLSDLDLDLDINMSTLTIPSPAYTGNVTISGTSGSNYTYTVGATGASGYFYNTPGMNGSSFISASPSSGLTVKGDAEFEGDVKIQGHSILHVLKKLEDRLAILQEPDPAKLEKYAALKKAYDHYKTLERLIGED